MLYTPIAKPNQIICGTGIIAVTTGWTVKEAIAKRLDKSQYAAIGNLYSPTRGISILIRNLLANPQVRYLVVLNATKEDKNAGASQVLLDFFRFGVEKKLDDCGNKIWAIKSERRGSIDGDIPLESLERLRNDIYIIEASSIDSCLAEVFAINEPDSVLPIWREPEIYPIIEKPSAAILPGHRYGHVIHAANVAEGWVKILHRIRRLGNIRPTGYDGTWQELVDLIAVISDEPDNFYFPEPNYLPINREFINDYISQILDDSPYKEGVKYTYGQRLRSWFGHDQIEQVINKLINEIDSASAVMSLWDVKTDHIKSGSPCLNHIWVRIVNNELSLTATFRSNDMFGAWPANAMGLRALQRHIRDGIEARSPYKLKLGALITISQSAHIYDDCYENADSLIKQQYRAICKEDYNDPTGNFIIEVEEDLVIVSQTNLDGEIAAKYQGKNCLKLIREICNENPAIEPGHAAYLGMELQKAFDCLKLGKCYVQDKVL